MNLKPSEVLDAMKLTIEPNDAFYEAERIKEARRMGDKSQMIADLATEEGQIALGIPPRYHGAECSDFPSFQGEIEGLAMQKIPLLTLVGAVGVGKTRALYAMYRAVLREGRKCKLFSVPVLIKELQALSARGGGEELERLRDIYEARYVVLLDDLGMEKETAFTINDLDIIIGQREKWDLPTAITSNLPIREIAEKLDKRIADRLAGGTVLEFRGKSKRLGK